jgi:GT2 family glycosyltransferase
MPRASVILPAYNSSSTIRACLEALRAQSFRDFEVIVVNSSQEDLTAAAMKDFPEVLFIQSPARLLPHAARNRGAREARGAFLVFSDPDCVAHRDWLTHLVSAMDSGHAVAGGAMALASPAWFESGVHLCKFHSLLECQAAAPRWILPTANVAYSRQAWDCIGPFDGELFSGDAILSWRARDSGFRTWFEPRALVRHHHGGTMTGFVRERLRRGTEFGAVRAIYEQWSAGRIIARLLATPLLIAIVLGRAAVDAARGRWLLRYLWTFPLQVLGHGGWAIGEARGCRRVLNGSGKSLPAAAELRRDSRP